MKSEMFQATVRTPAAPTVCPARPAPASIVDRIIEGDCATVLKSFPEGCIDLVVTDPPYLVRYRERSRRFVRNDDNAPVLAAFADVYRVLKPNAFCLSF
jgi:site-specific DNA-methyltransferase (adenine-specific)